MIETSSLTKQYSGFTALDEFDLKVGAGEIFGLIGPSGAGKSTVIRILATLLQPSSGTAHVGGHDVTHLGREVRSLIGYLPDPFGTYPNLRVWEYLEFFAAAYEIEPTTRADVVNEVLETADLTDKREALVETLSHGMQQRLGLARVLIHDPQVLLLDEPTAGLGRRARLEIYEILRELHSLGKTIFLSSQTLSELAEICTSIGILYGGRLLASGGVPEVLAQMGGESIVRVRVEGPAEPAVEALNTMNAVSRTEIVRSHRDLGSRDPEVDSRELLVHLQMDQQIDRSPEVAAFLVERGFALQHLMKEELNLEEAYLRLTKKEDVLD